MLPGEMAEGGVETREQRRRRGIGLGLDPDGESEEDTGEGDTGDGDGGRGGPGDGDGDDGDPGDGGGGPGGPGESDSGSDAGDDETARAIKKQSKSLLILAKSIKDLVSKKEDGEYYVDAATGVKKVKKRISPPYLQRRQRRETRSTSVKSKGLV